MFPGFRDAGTGAAHGLGLSNSSHIMQSSRQMKPLRVGFVPLIDAAPLIMARELGLYEKYGLRVRLSREIGWATIRDKIIFGQLEAAHALGAMPFAATAGRGCVATDCLTGLVLNLNGNGVTLSKELWNMGVRDALSFKKIIDLNRDDRIFTLGVVFNCSSHHHLLRTWLQSGGIDPDNDVNIVIVPAPSMFDNLRNGNLDGYCVGEPWNTVAVRQNVGWCAATSLQLSPRHPEKVLMVRNDFSEQHPEEHLRLIAAVYEACQWCDATGNREELARVLSRRLYVNTSFKVLKDCLLDSFDFGTTQRELLPEFHVFNRFNANAPTPDKAAWVMNNLLRTRTAHETRALPPSSLQKIFREDIFSAAMELVENGVPAELQTEIEPEPVTACC